MNKIRKVFFVVSTESTVNAFLLNHLRELSKKFEVTVLVNTSDSNFLFAQGIEVQVIPIKISRGIDFLSDVRCLIFLFRLFQINRPDAVHSITPKAGLLGMFAAYLTFVPMRIHTFTGQVWVTKGGLLKFLLKLIDRFVGFLSSFCIVDSPSQRNFLINEKIINEKKSIVFGLGSVSGVNLNKFKASKIAFKKIRSELNIPIDAFVFIYLGRLNKDKGVLDLADAFSQIFNNNAYLLLVGADEGGFAEQVKFLNSAKLDLIRIVGFTNFPERYLAASNVLCLPSYREGFGSVIVEAAAMGVPAIASNIYGISDAIVDNHTGLLHQPKDVKSILCCLETFINDPVKLKDFGTQAKIRAFNTFDAVDITRYWVDFYMQKIK